MDVPSEAPPFSALKGAIIALLPQDPGEVEEIFKRYQGTLPLVAIGGISFLFLTPYLLFLILLHAVLFGFAFAVGALVVNSPSPEGKAPPDLRILLGVFPWIWLVGLGLSLFPWVGMSHFLGYFLGSGVPRFLLWLLKPFIIFLLGIQLGNPDLMEFPPFQNWLGRLRDENVPRSRRWGILLLVPLILVLFMATGSNLLFFLGIFPLLRAPGVLPPHLRDILAGGADAPAFYESLLKFLKGIYNPRKPKMYLNRVTLKCGDCGGFFEISREEMTREIICLHCGATDKL